MGTVIRKIHTNPSLFITVPYSLTVYCRSVVPLLRLAVLCKCHTGVTGGQTCSACDTALEVVIVPEHHLGDQQGEGEAERLEKVVGFC